MTCKIEQGSVQDADNPACAVVDENGPVVDDDIIVCDIWDLDPVKFDRVWQACADIELDARQRDRGERLFLHRILE